MPKWIRFLLVEQKAKTGVWRVETKESYDILGYVKWFPHWRKYAFFPNVDTVYENDCLRDIARFIGEQMNERKMRKL